MFIYEVRADRSEVRRMKADPTPEETAGRWEAHARNRATLERIARAGDRSFDERHRAELELEVCRRKLEWWERRMGADGRDPRSIMQRIRRDVRAADRARDVGRGAARGTLVKAGGARSPNALPSR